MPQRILIVDDDPVIAGRLAEQRARYAVATASNGFEALKRLDDAAPDVVLLELRMPDLNGPGVAAR